MPFAKEFCRGMGFPREGEVIDGFRIVSVKVEHVGVSSGRYEYPIEIVVEGEGSKEKVRRAFRRYFDARKTLFSGYGNPYQCVPGKIQVKRLGEGRFRIESRGTCVRVYLRDELRRFLAHLSDLGLLAGMDDEDREKVVKDYLARYQAAFERGS